MALDVRVESETYDLTLRQETEAFGRVHHVADLGPFPLLDAAATCDAAGRELTLAVVNRDRDRAHAAVVELGGAAVAGRVAVTEVNGPDVSATNSFEAPTRVGVRERQLDVTGGRFEYTFPAHSVTVLRLSILPFPCLANG